MNNNQKMMMMMKTVLMDQQQLTEKSRDSNETKREIKDEESESMSGSDNEWSGKNFISWFEDEGDVDAQKERHKLNENSRWTQTPIIFFPFFSLKTMEMYARHTALKVTWTERTLSSKQK